ncbi:hypothetical protein EQG49_01970 [Periweissella cryptocerci]|uniref:Uncharacterized protein n=1 Tax=Periweissella cryptocerci TaxID=2506420 RepID=A0A4P6YRQ8_9LACO|nr:hypothetical protein [Periweissella cryptocerci]QBO35316.1 hypothetical protein EQG49_01970 [Periweissella cryptocerci]
MNKLILAFVSFILAILSAFGLALMGNFSEIMQSSTLVAGNITTNYFHTWEVGFPIVFLLVTIILITWYLKEESEK